MLETLKELDTSVFLTLNGLNSPVLDQVMWWISEKIKWVPLYAIILFFIIRRFKLKTIPIIISIAIIITLCDQVSVNMFKNMFERLRPSHEPSLEGLVHLVKGYKGGSFGFVSSHATNTFGLAIFVLLLFRNRTVTVLILIWALIVSYSRIYLGVHYPGDIICGALLGSSIATGVFLLYRIITQKIFGNQ